VGWVRSDTGLYGRGVSVSALPFPMHGVREKKTKKGCDSPTRPAGRLKQKLSRIRFGARRALHMLNPNAREWRPPQPGGLSAGLAAAAFREEEAGAGGGVATTAAAGPRPTAAAVTPPPPPLSWARRAAAAAASSTGEAITSARGTPTAPVAMRSGGGRGPGSRPAAPPLSPMAAPPPPRAAPAPAPGGGEDLLTFDDLFHASASDAEDGPGCGGGRAHTPTRSSVSEERDGETERRSRGPKTKQAGGGGEGWSLTFPGYPCLPFFQTSSLHGGGGAPPPAAPSSAGGAGSYAGPSPSPSRAAAVAEAEKALAALRLAAAGGPASVIASPHVALADGGCGGAGAEGGAGAPDVSAAALPPSARVEVGGGSGAKAGVKEAEEGAGAGPPGAASPPPPPPPAAAAAEGAAPATPSPSAAAAAAAALPPPHPTRVGPDDFTLLRVVGRGAFGKVFQVRQRGTGKVYAMKVMAKAPILAKGHGAYVRAERDVLTSVIHPYIVTLRYSFQTDAKLYLVLDFVAGGHLFFQLYRQGIFSEDLARLYTAEIVLALAHLHGLGFVHRDLKPENVLLDAAGHVKVTDFGLAKAGLAHDEGGRAANSFIGTVEYMAPEVVSGRGHGKAVDWWSVGILLYEMLCGVPPFRAKGRPALQRQILGGKLKLPPYLSREAQALLRALLVREPPKRLGYGPTGSADVMGHPFFGRVDWAALAEGRVASPFRPSLGQHDSVENFDRIWTDLAPEDSPVGTPRAGSGGGAGGGGGGPAPAPPAPPPSSTTPCTPPAAAFAGFTYIAPADLSSRVEAAWAKAAAAATAEREKGGGAGGGGEGSGA